MGMAVSYIIGSIGLFLGQQPTDSVRSWDLDDLRV
jgi:hypothetical protein